MVQQFTVLVTCIDNDRHNIDKINVSSANKVADNAYSEEDSKENDESIDDKDDTKKQSLEKVMLKDIWNKEGYLRYCTSSSFFYKERLVVLDENQLLCYMDHQKKEIIEKIDLSQFKKVTYEAQTSRFSATHYRFELLPHKKGGKKEIFTSEFEFEIQDWIRILKYFVKDPS